LLVAEFAEVDELATLLCESACRDSLDI
jgi:hypothetical protein